MLSATGPMCHVLASTSCSIPTTGTVVYQVERVVWGVSKDDMNAPTVNVIMKEEG